MIAKLPRWVWAGAAVLAFNAGMINAVAILGFVHKGITHVTGNCSLLSIALMEGDRGGVAQLFFIVASFFLGSVLSGVLLGDAHLRMGRRYGLVMALESVLLVISTYGSLKGSIHGEYFVSMAAGLQNAMASTYSEAIVRTTHLTGILTDLGALAGNKLRGMRVDAKRARLLSVILGAFALGWVLRGRCSPLPGPLGHARSRRAHGLIRRRIRALPQPAYPAEHPSSPTALPADPGRACRPDIRPALDLRTARPVPGWPTFDDTLTMRP